MAWEDERDRCQRNEQLDRLKAASGRQATDCQIATQLLLRTLTSVTRLQQEDSTLKGVSDQDLFRSVVRVCRVLPELHAAERKLLAPRPPAGSSASSAPAERGPRIYRLVDGTSADDETTGAEEADVWFAPQPWERQADRETGNPEPQRAFHAFTLFRDLPAGQRTLREVTRLLRASKSSATAEPSGVGEKPRRRERVSETVESWSSRWHWVARARAWDAELDREQRREELKQVIEMRTRQSEEIKLALGTARALLRALGKRVQNGLMFEGENTKMIRCASEAIGVLERLHEAERAVKGNAEDYEEKREVKISQYEFVLVQSNCECGHPHSAHDQENEDFRLVPCTIPGCGCQKFKDGDAEEEVAPPNSGTERRTRLSDRLRCADEGS